MTNDRNISVPYVDIAGQHAGIKTEIMQAVERVIDHGLFVLGPEVAEFEARFAQLCQTKFAVGVNSGTDALILGLRALDIGPGDEVITVPNSFVASTSCVELVGAKPVFVDVGSDYNIDPSLIEAAITSRTKAILPVHLTGRPAAMDAILEIAQPRGLYVIEDAAQSVFANLHGQPVGSFGDVGCFSCHPLKTLNACGDAGVITTSNPNIHRRLTELRNIGLRTRDESVVWAGNSRLDTIQAAILLVKLRYIEEWTANRRANAAFYREQLGKIEGPAFKLPIGEEQENAVYHTFVIRAQMRDQLREFLAARAVATAVHYPIPIHLQPVAIDLGYKPGDFPETEAQANEILSLPIYPELTTEQLQHVASTVLEFFTR
jgi:dTDP-4-amino-4,6-dideoxygalactose transaminase